MGFIAPVWSDRCLEKVPAGNGPGFFSSVWLDMKYFKKVNTWAEKWAIL